MEKGVIGIVASRPIETYYRPTVILTESNGFATGSARSVQGYDLYQAIEACSDLLRVSRTCMLQDLHLEGKYRTVHREVRTIRK